jgi:glycosyltransferase involved in cell wall biosynthesis
VTPVFNDWPSCAQLIDELDRIAGQLDGVLMDVLIVDDGSGQVDSNLLNCSALSSLNRISITELACNLGHQRAIAVGLYVAVEAGCYDHIIIMDSDGEDQPRDLLRLLEAQRRESGQVIVASRTKRSEGLLFRAFYALYKRAYRILTGNEINFGNFSIISHSVAKRLLHMPEMWNNFPSALLRSRLPYKQMETVRGKRFFGASKMNFVNLVIHGLNAISVSSEIVFVRVMMISMLIGFLSILGGLAVVLLRVFTDLAIPGWASDVIGSIAVILTQTMFFFFVSVFLLLHSRSNPSHTPLSVIPGYIARSYDVLVDGKPAV